MPTLFEPLRAMLAKPHPACQLHMVRAPTRALRCAAWRSVSAGDLLPHWRPTCCRRMRLATPRVNIVRIRCRRRPGAPPFSTTDLAGARAAPCFILPPVVPVGTSNNPRHLALVPRPRESTSPELPGCPLRPPGASTDAHLVCVGGKRRLLQLIGRVVVTARLLTF